MGEPREIRDPVHGFVFLNGKEVEILDTRVFQRLRGIRQLAFASLVYPGALHTRFDHSLGVCHIAHSMSKALKLTDEDRLVGLAALLHDLGHGPFSHVSESALEMYADKAALRACTPAGEPAHERITADLICRDAELTHLIGHKDCEKVAKLLSEGYGEPVVRSIVSGPIDADKQDYLLRDSYFCGVKYGVFDLHQLHRQFQVMEDPADGSKQLGVDPDGIHALEQFVLAKYYLTTQVYRHRVRLVTDEMLLRAISLGIEIDKIEELRKLYAWDSSEGFLQNYIAWDDRRFLLTFGGDEKLKDKYCFKILNNLHERRLLKRVFFKRVAEFPEPCRDPVSRISEPAQKEVRSRVEEALSVRISEQLGRDLDRRLVIVHAYTIKSVGGFSRSDEGRLLVAGRPEPKTFDEESALFRSIGEGFSEAFVEVYAPVSYETDQERRVLQDKVRESIMETLCMFFQEGGGTDGNP